MRPSFDLYVNDLPCCPHQRRVISGRAIIGDVRTFDYELGSRLGTAWLPLGA